MEAQIFQIFMLLSGQLMIVEDLKNVRASYMQACNQLGTPGGGEEFSEWGSKFFKLRPIVVNYAHFAADDPRWIL